MTTKSKTLYCIDFRGVEGYYGTDREAVTHWFNQFARRGEAVKLVAIRRVFRHTLAESFAMRDYRRAA